MATISPNGVLTPQQIQVLQACKPDELVDKLKDLFTEAAQSGDPIAHLDQVASVIPMQTIQEAFGIQDALKEARDSLEWAKIYLNTKEPVALSTHIGVALDGMIAVVESLINAFGLGDFLQPAESQIHADMKSNRLMQLLSQFSMVTAALLPAVGAETATKILAGFFAFVAAISVVWPKIRPMTKFLPANAENLSEKTKGGSFTYTVPAAKIEEIDSFLRNDRHVLLVGPSRVGKTLLSEVYAQFATQKGMRVFRINTADLIKRQAAFTGGNNNILKEISDVMGRHRSKILLILDEVHKACGEGEEIADKLKPYLDVGGNFPHVIAITTDEEYELVKQNNAFKNRFENVKIKSTDIDATIPILTADALRNSLKPILGEEVLEHIYNKTGAKESPQPYTSIQLLKKCIDRTGFQKSDTEQKIVGLRDQILSLRSNKAAYFSKKYDPKIQELERELTTLSQDLENKRADFDKVYQVKKTLDRAMEIHYSSALKVAALGNASFGPSAKKEWNRFILVRELLRDILVEDLQKKSSSIGIKSIVDKALVDEVLATTRQE